LTQKEEKSEDIHQNDDRYSALPQELIENSILLYEDEETDSEQVEDIYFRKQGSQEPASECEKQDQTVEVIKSEALSEEFMLDIDDEKCLTQDQKVKREQREYLQNRQEYVDAVRVKALSVGKKQKFLFADSKTISSPGYLLNINNKVKRELREYLRKRQEYVDAVREKALSARTKQEFLYSDSKTFSSTGDTTKRFKNNNNRHFAAFTSNNAAPVKIDKQRTVSCFVDKKEKTNRTGNTVTYASKDKNSRLKMDFKTGMSSLAKPKDTSGSFRLSLTDDKKSTKKRFAQWTANNI